MPAETHCPEAPLAPQQQTVWWLLEWELTPGQALMGAGAVDARNQHGEIHLIDASQIMEHMEVVGSDGQHVGTVDKLCVKLTKKDPAAQGQHHIINLDLVGSVEGGKLMLTMPAAQAMQEEKALQD